MTMHKHTEPSEIGDQQPDARRKTAFLPRGLGIGAEDVAEELTDLLSENRRFRLAWAAAELSLGLVTQGQFEAQWPEADLTSLLDDGEFASTVEMICSRADLQDAARQDLVRRTMMDAVGVLGERLNAPDCSINQARGAATALLALNDALNKPADRTCTSKVRLLSLLLGVATIGSPEHPDGVAIRIDGTPAALSAIRALRCTELSEVRKVLDLFNEATLSGDMTLEGW